MGAGTQTTTTQSNPKPYKPARPLINTALNDAMNAYSKGIGGKTYTGSMVVPFSNQTTQGMAGITNAAQGNMNGQGVSGQYQNIINNGGFNDQQKGALENWKTAANATFDPNNDPAFSAILSKMQNDARNQVGMSASAMGRYGSGIEQGNVARNVGDVTNQMLSNEYNRFMQRKDASNAALFNANQAGIGNMSQAFSGMQDPSKALMGVGAMNEDLYKRQLDDQRRIFDDKQNQPWQQMQRLMAMGNLTGQYGQTSGTSTAPGPNPFLTTLGNVSTGYGLLGGLFGGGSSGGTY